MTPLETYLRELRDIRSLGAGVPETSYYPALANLLTEVGKHLKPKVRCVMSLANRGAGLPDGGLFTAEQFPKPSDAEPLPGQPPARGVIEVKPVKDDAWVTAEGEQVSRYWGKYRQVLVTNYRDFVLVGQDTEGKPAKLESFRLADNEKAFWAAAQHPRSLAEKIGARFEEYLLRVMRHAAPLAAPEDVAWFLASYARDARARIEGVELPALATVRAALEEALGLKFEGKKGEHFFRSSLVQTLFYGVFSAWVLWAKQHPPSVAAAYDRRPQSENNRRSQSAATAPRFDWYTTARYLRVPMISKLFHLVADPQELEALKLTEVLDWAALVLNRVDRRTFFDKFQESHAVQYFYEPFLEAFDPELRKELGVWYTPPEIVKYMVERVDTVLRQELGLADGLADKRVYVLDPCCGTGSYLVEVLDRIHRTLKERGEDALLAHDLKEAAQQRIFGFEIMPAPFVVSHLQLGLLLQNLGAPLDVAPGFSPARAALKGGATHGPERVGVYLTNALTGWEPPKGPKQRLMFTELEEERDAAEHVKREVPILVILGNPPYNSFAGIAKMEEERDLTEAYRTTTRAPAPQGQGLNDLYVRFFRMAERRIVEKTGRGVVCLISNYSWLDGLSFTGMREKYLEAFDRIWIDCLNGDKYKTGKLTPEGEPDPSVFSTEFNREGIQVGTTISLLVRVGEPSGLPREREALPYQNRSVRFRHLWGKTKRQQLLESAAQDGKTLYQELTPPLDLGLPFAPAQVSTGYLQWPLVPELFESSSPGVNTSRDLDLVEIDLPKLKERILAYFDKSISDHDLKAIAPSLMTASARYDPVATRRYLLERGLATGYFVRYSYRPFDTRHVYWHPETKLIDEKREDHFSAFQAGNLFLTSRQKAERESEGTPFFITRWLADRHLTRPGCNCFPLTSGGLPFQGQSEFAGAGRNGVGYMANLSLHAREYLANLGIENLDNNTETTELIWMHALGIGYSPAYLSENADGIRQDWPRIPLPDTKEALLASAALGRQIAALLDTETPFDVAAGLSRHPESGDVKSPLHEPPVGTPALQKIAAFTLPHGMPLKEAEHFAVTAGWGHAGKGGITMPGKGKIVERDYTPAERSTAVPAVSAGEDARATLGDRTLDVYLNDVAYWSNIPIKVWEYTIGGYQVIKKWLSYREEKLLGRVLTKEEVRYVQEMARRIAAILLLEPSLDANYRRVKEHTYTWKT
jgi:hypothetical protein